jgi:hypothetical protein
MNGGDGARSQRRGKLHSWARGGEAAPDASGGSSATRDVTRTARSEQRSREATGGSAQLPQCTFLFIQIFSNPFEFEIVKDGPLCSKIFK